MRMMMKVAIPVQAGNKSIAEGALPKLMMSFIEQHSPEATYFVAEGGQRVALFFFDLKEPSDIPVVAERFFMDLDASIELTPAMSPEDMSAGADKAMKRR